MGHTLLKLTELVDRYNAYNFYLECFSLGRQTREQVRSTFFEDLKILNS